MEIKFKHILLLLVSFTLLASTNKLIASEQFPVDENVSPTREEHLSGEELINQFPNYNWRDQLIKELPESLHSCIPNEAVKGRLWSIIENNQGRSYYLIGLVSKSERIDVIFQNDGRSCSALTPLTARAQHFSILSYVAPEIVLPLLLNQYKLIATELGGIEVLKQELFKYYSDLDTWHYVPVEEILVSDQLGIYFSEDFTGIIVVTPDGNYPLAEFRKMQ